MTTALQRGEHGTTSYRLGCRCATCRRAMRDGAQLDRLAAAVRRGREPAWRVRSYPARRRVVELRARGWTLAEIAAAAGVAVSSVHRVLAARRCSSLVERAILAVELPAGSPGVQRGHVQMMMAPIGATTSNTGSNTLGPTGPTTSNAGSNTLGPAGLTAPS